MKFMAATNLCIADELRFLPVSSNALIMSGLQAAL